MEIASVPTANVAVGGADPIGKALAGWPALSMLVSVKLLFAMFDHQSVDLRTTVPDDQRTSGTVPDVPGTVRQTGRDDAAPSGTVPAEQTNIPTPPATGPADRPADPTQGQPGTPGGRTAPPNIRTVSHLIPAARAARATLASGGRSLSRDNLADAMRDGHGVSNERASFLLKILNTPQDLTAVGTTSVPGQPPRTRRDMASPVVSPGSDPTSGRFDDAG